MAAAAEDAQGLAAARLEAAAAPLPVGAGAAHGPCVPAEALRAALDRAEQARSMLFVL